MILIDHPYVSDFLIETIKKNQFPIVSTKAAKELISEKKLNWIDEENAIDQLMKNPNQKVYSNSENVINWVEKSLYFTELPQQISNFKNKLKLRELLQDVYPNYFFKGVAFNELDELNIESINTPFIIKPTIGFFSLGVHKVDTHQEWETVLAKIKSEVSHIKTFYPSEVLDTNNFIIEECIKGEEFAIDCYFNSSGEAVILNIMHHIFSSAKDVSDRVYSTSKEIITSNLKSCQNLVEIIGKKTNLKNFPIHIEVRIDNNGTIIPIEVNPMRFGGWCTTGDISNYAFGVNSYEYYFNEKKPDWDELFKGKESKKYSLILLDNNSGYKESYIDYFDYNKLLRDFENPLVLRKIDYQKFPVFGFLFTETTIGKEEELSAILTSNLKKYISLKS